VEQEYNRNNQEIQEHMDLEIQAVTEAQWMLTQALEVVVQAEEENQLKVNKVEQEEHIQFQEVP
jgi:hypothetical protein